MDATNDLRHKDVSNATDHRDAIKRVPRITEIILTQRSDQSNFFSFITQQKRITRQLSGFITTTKIQQ